MAERPASGFLDDPHRQHLARDTLLHPPALQRAPGRAGGGQGGGDHRRRQPLAKAPPCDRADHPAGHRGHVAPRVRIHGEGVRPRDRSDRRGPGQRHSADNDLVLQPLVPAILLRRGRGTQQRAARAGADLRPGVPVAQPGLVEAQLGGQTHDPPAEVEGPAMALHSRGDRCPRESSCSRSTRSSSARSSRPRPCSAARSTGCRTRRRWTTTEPSWGPRRRIPRRR